MRDDSITCIDARNGRDAVYQACQRVLIFGKESEPRGMRTREILGARITIADPTDTIPDGISRKGLLPAIAYAEALQNISGLPAPGVMAEISKGFPAPTSRWADDVPTYGTRLHEDDQLGAVARKLRADPDSRQAVALIWRSYDMEDRMVVRGPNEPLAWEKSQAHNLCTIALQFVLRRGALHMFAHMRSNDCWHGLCYDLFQFAQVQLTLCNVLGVEPGVYVHTANSLHLYDKHWDAAYALTPPDDATDVNAPIRPFGVGHYDSGSFESARMAAQKILQGELPLDATADELMYWDELQKYVTTKEARGADAQ